MVLEVRKAAGAVSHVEVRPAAWPHSLDEGILGRGNGWAAQRALDGRVAADDLGPVGVEYVSADGPYLPGG